MKDKVHNRKISQMQILVNYFIANTLYKNERLEEAVEVCTQTIMNIKEYFGHGEHEFIIDLLTIQVTQTYSRMTQA